MSEAARRAFALFAVLAAACSRIAAERPLPPRLDGVSRCDYHVRALPGERVILDVKVSCEGRGVRGLEAEDRRVAAEIASVDSSAGTLTRTHDAFALPRRLPHAEFRYRVDLDRLAELDPDVDFALRRERSLIAPASSFLLYPLPLDVGTEVRVWVDTPSGVEFATGLEHEGDHYRLQAHEISVATYSAFGRLEKRRLAIAPRAADQGAAREIEVVRLDGALGVSTDVLASWVNARARAVADFYGVFPALHTAVFVVPMPARRDVVFGKVLPESAPGVALLVGSDASESALAEDWVVVHELFHIGVPSFYREGKWFDEGLATYFEPIIRARAGLYAERDLWQSFAVEMPRALPALERDGLEHVRGYLGMYWGGAVYCLAADVAARRQSAGARGLEDGLRRVFASGGHAWDVWPLAKTLRIADGAFAAPVLTPLAGRYAQQPAPFDLEGLFTALGVHRSAAGIELSEDAPLAWVRHAIVAGAPALSSEHPRPP